MWIKRAAGRGSRELSLWAFCGVVKHAEAGVCCPLCSLQFVTLAHCPCPRLQSEDFPQEERGATNSCHNGHHDVKWTDGDIKVLPWDASWL